MRAAVCESAAAAALEPESRKTSCTSWMGGAGVCGRKLRAHAAWLAPGRKRRSRVDAALSEFACCRVLRFLLLRRN